MQPGLAILIECAFEAEPAGKAADFLEGIIKRFNECAEKGLPLSGGEYEVFDIFLPTPTGDADIIAVGLLSDEMAAEESVQQSDMSPAADGFIKYISERAAGIDLAKFAPAIIGVGIADSGDEAWLLSRLAVFRPPDRHSIDAETAECERRILATINRNGPGAGGYGGGHTAIAVSIEQTGEGYVAVCPGDYFTRTASMKL